MKDNHSVAIVPFEAWLYHSPKVKLQGRSFDIGIVCEALLFYDKVFICIDNRDQFNSLIGWFKRQDALEDLLYLIEGDVINFVFYSFMTYPIYDGRIDSYSLWNLDDDETKRDNVFRKRILYNVDLNKITNTRERNRLYRVITDEKFVELKATGFGDAIENARSDAVDTQKTDVLVQSFVDNLYHEFGLKESVTIQSSIRQDDDKNIISWNVDLKAFNQRTNNVLEIHRGIPLSGILHCNRLVKTASLLKSDLYVGSVMSSLVNNKLLEASSRDSKIENIIQELNERVEFPKISELINRDTLGFRNILDVRIKAKQFRLWLQQEGDRDRDAIVAYQNEVAKKTGLVKFGGSMLSIAGAALAGIIGASLSGPVGGAIGAVTGRGIDKFIGSLTREWKPVVFGDWATKYVSKNLHNDNL